MRIVQILLLGFMAVFTVTAEETNRTPPADGKGFAWESRIPEDCPFPRSPSLTGLFFTGRHSDYRCGDTWYPCWASDGNLYSPWTDAGSQMYFRQAQVAPTLLPEFQGNVVAVPTALFWSDELAAIEEKRGKEDLMRHLLKSQDKGQANADGKMTEAQINEYIKDYEAKLITPAEAVLWQRGASNGGHHYLGAAKILAPIGKAFAEAMMNLQKAQRQGKQ